MKRPRARLPVVGLLCLALGIVGAISWVSHSLLTRTDNSVDPPWCVRRGGHWSREAVNCIGYSCLPDEPRCREEWSTDSGLHRFLTLSPRVERCIDERAVDGGHRSACYLACTEGACPYGTRCTFGIAVGAPDAGFCTAQPQE